MFYTVSPQAQMLVPGTFLERYTIELGRTRDLSTGLAQPSTILAKLNGYFFQNKAPTRLLCTSLELASSRKSNK